MTVWAMNAASNAWLRARPIVPPAILDAKCGTAMHTIIKTTANAVYMNIADTGKLPEQTVVIIELGGTP